MRPTISLVSGMVAILASLVLVASLGAPWYRSEIIPFAAGQEFAVTDFSGWRALSFIDIVLVLAAAAAAVLVLVGLVLSMRQPLLASAFFGAIAVVLVVYRMVDQPLAEEISKISDEQGFGLRWGIWAALAAAVVLTAAATCAVRTTSSKARSVVAAAPPV